MGKRTSNIKVFDSKYREISVWNVKTRTPRGPRKRSLSNQPGSSFPRIILKILTRSRASRKGIAQNIRCSDTPKCSISTGVQVLLASVWIDREGFAETSLSINTKIWMTKSPGKSRWVCSGFMISEWRTNMLRMSESLPIWTSTVRAVFSLCLQTVRRVQA